MNDKGLLERDEIHSKVLRAGRRTYFFDVRETKAGDYYLTITESKKFTHDDGSFHFKKHKIYLYKEDFHEFRDILGEMVQYVFNEKGEEVISDRHQSSYEQPQIKTEDKKEEVKGASEKNNGHQSFTDVSFDDI